MKEYYEAMLMMVAAKEKTMNAVVKYMIPSEEGDTHTLELENLMKADHEDTVEEARRRMIIISVHL